MEDTSDQQIPFDSMQMRWADQQHPFRHSHHGTPASEYQGFAWGSPPLQGSLTGFSQSPPQSSHSSLQPLIMPTWPSMLGGTQPAFYPSMLPQHNQAPITSPPLATPISAASSRSGTSIRKTLSDDDRRRMCKYAEDNPTAKQTEIGYMFGVERSTVSKVLRKKDQYLNQTQPKESPRSPPTKRSKSRVPDIEKTLSAWVTKEQKKGSPITDEAIREQATYFALIPGPSENTTLSLVNTPGWLEKFKQKHHLTSLGNGYLRKDSVADQEIGGMGSNTASNRQSPKGISPTSPSEATLDSSSPPLDDPFKPEDHKNDFSNPPVSMKRRKSPPSISTAFTDMGSSSACFTPHLLSPTSPFFSSDSQRQSLTSPLNSTFPPLDQFISSPNSSTPMSPSYLGTFSSPDHNNNLPPQPLLDSIDETMEEQSHQHQHQHQHQITHYDTIDPIATMLPSTTHASMEIKALAAQALEEQGFRDGRNPSQEDAREALRVVLEFFEGQPSGSLDLQEGMLLGRLVEKLQLRREG